MLNFFRLVLNPKEKTVLEMTDGELIRSISNWMEVSEAVVFQIACEETGSRMTYDEFFRTGKLTPELRQELRRAYPQVLKNFK